MAAGGGDAILRSGGLVCFYQTPSDGGGIVGIGVVTKKKCG
jgi:hypothetical protein